MKMVNVGAFKCESFRGGSYWPPDIVYKTPQDWSSYGYMLVICLACGTIYAADREAELYRERKVEERVKDVQCIGCGEILSEHWSPYPDQYLGRDGAVVKCTVFHKLEEVVMTFPALYD